MANFFNYIGTSLEYPLAVASGAGRVVSGKAAIEQSINQILSIEVGTLQHNPYFGSRMHQLLFLPNDLVAISLGRTFIVEALNKWEKRIQVMDIEGSNSNETRDENGMSVNVSIIRFSITYRIVATNNIENYVFPFYRELKY